MWDKYWCYPCITVFSAFLLSIKCNFWFCKECCKGFYHKLKITYILSNISICLPPLIKLTDLYTAISEPQRLLQNYVDAGHCVTANFHKQKAVGTQHSCLITARRRKNPADIAEPIILSQSCLKCSSLIYNYHHTINSNWPGIVPLLGHTVLPQFNAATIRSAFLLYVEWWPSIHKRAIVLVFHQR